MTNKNTSQPTCTPDALHALLGPAGTDRQECLAATRPEGTSVAFRPKPALSLANAPLLEILLAASLSTVQTTARLTFDRALLSWRSCQARPKNPVAQQQSWKRLSMEPTSYQKYGKK